MKVFNEALSKIRNNKKWFTSMMAVLVTMLVAIIATIILLPEAKANAIVEDPVGKTVTYNIPAIIAENTGSSNIVEVNIDINKPDYQYYIVGDANSYDNVSIVVNYNISVSKEVPIYLDNVKINMAENAPILKFEPSTNENTSTEGSYKVIVKGDCAMISTCVGATYPVIQVESVSASLYQLKSYNGEDYLNPENYYDMVERSFDTKVEFTSYEFAKDESQTECSLKIVTASGSYGAGIGTTAGTVDISAENIELSNGSGTPINDLADGTLMKIFNKPLKPGAQALYGAGGYTGDITIGGALELTVIGNGYGACIGGGGSYVYGKSAKDAGNVTINGGTLYINAKDVKYNNNTYQIPAIGGGFNVVEESIGNKKNVIINGGSVYIRDNGLQFGENGANPVNSAGETLYLYETDYVKNIDDDGKLLIESKRYEEKYKADIDVIDDYVDIYLEYNSKDYTKVLSYGYKGFGYSDAVLGSQLYFYLPASPLCSLTINENSFLSKDVPLFEVFLDGEQLSANDGAYWMPGGSEAVVVLKNIPAYMNIADITLTDVKTGVPTYYTDTFVYDEETGNYTVTLRIAADSELSIMYSSDINIQYDYGFLDGDIHEVINNSPVEYELGEELLLNDSYVATEDLVFAGWYSEITGQKITAINSANLKDIMDAYGDIKLKAKWNVKVSYDMGLGTGDDIEDVILPYGQRSDIVISSVIPELEYHIFEGWILDGELYGSGYICNVLPTKNIVITASYIQDSFFLYVDASANKFNRENVDIYVGINGTQISEANNLLLKNPDGTYVTKEINGVTYYVAVAPDKANIAILLTPKPGYIISGKNVTVTDGSGNQIVLGTSGGEDGNITIELTINKDDVYISTRSEFVLREYEISFYDGMTANGGDRLWTDTQFKYTILDLDKPLSSILGLKANEIYHVNNRFFEFAGWKDKLTGKVYTNDDALLENLGDVILVAQWRELERYPINVDVIDNSNGEKTDNVFGIPFYMNDDGSLEEVYTEKVLNEETGKMETIAYVKENDRIVVKFYYYDNDDIMHEVTDGVILRNMQLKYTNNSGNGATEDIATGAKYFVCPKAKAGTSIDVKATIDIQKYNIVYWDTRNIQHDNPVTYTFFDEIELENLLENVGWLLVEADEDDSNFDDVKTTSITKIERGTTGNLVLKADWGDYSETLYNAEIDKDIQNGKLEIIYPVDRENYRPNETLVIKVTPNPGYKLKDNVINYKEVQEIRISPRLLSGFNFKRDIAMYGATEITGEDGIYLVDMPEKNIVITAQFEMVEYSITYKGVDDLKNDNVTTLTYFDVVDLLPIEKEGYKFIGWKDENGNIISKITNAVSDIVLTAEFEEIKENDSADDSLGETETNETDSSGNETETNEPNSSGNEIETDNENSGGNDSNENETTADGSVDNETETTKKHLLGGGNSYGSDTYTGDTTNVTRLVLICVGAMIALVIVVLAKGDNKDDEKNEEADKNEDSDKNENTDAKEL